MELSTAQEILVIFLSVALAIFLVAAIVIAVMVVRLLKTLRLIADKAEKFVESAEAVGQVFKKASGPLGVLRFIQGLAGAVKHDKDDK